MLTSIPWTGAEAFTDGRCVSAVVAGGRVITGHEGGFLLSWSPQTPSRLAKLESEVQALATSADGKLVAAGASHSGKVTLFDLAGGGSRDLKTPGVSDPAYLGLAGDGRLLYAASGDKLCVLSCADGAVVAQRSGFPDSGVHYQYSCEFVIDEDLVISGTKKGLLIWNGKTSEVRHRIDLGFACRFLSRVGTLVLASDNGSGSGGEFLKVVDIQSGRVVAETVIGSMDSSPFWTDGKRAVVITEERSEAKVKIWSLASGEIESFDFDPDVSFNNPQILAELDGHLLVADARGIAQVGPLPPSSAEAAPPAAIVAAPKPLPARRRNNLLLSISGKKTLSAEQATAASGALRDRGWEPVRVDAGPLGLYALVSDVTPESVLGVCEELLGAAGIKSCSVKVSLGVARGDDPDFETPPFFTETLKITGKPARRKAASSAFKLRRESDWVVFDPKAEHSPRVRFAPDGKHALCAGATAKELAQRDGESGAIERILEAEPYSRATAVSPDGRLLAFGRNAVRVFDPAAEALLPAFGSVEERDVESIDFSPNGTLVASGAHNSLRVCRVGDGHRVGKQAGNSGGVLVRFWDDESMVVADSVRLMLRRVDDARPTVLYSENAGQVAGDLRVYPDRDLVFACGYAGAFAWRASTGEPLCVVDKLHCLAGALIDSEHFAALVTGTPMKLELWHLSRAERLAECEVATDESGMVYVHSLDVSPDGGRILVGHHRGVSLFRL